MAMRKTAASMAGMPCRDPVTILPLRCAHARYSGYKYRPPSSFQREIVQTNPANNSEKARKTSVTLWPSSTRVLFSTGKFWDVLVWA
eukprot:3657967-Rhodomonas_salina.2